MTEIHATPRVRKVAEQLGVDLATVKGTGVGGRIRVADVEAAAPRRPRPSGPTPVPRGVGSTDAMGRNPLVAAAYARDPRRAGSAAAKAPAPTLFAGGDLPPFTASGIDPEVLLQVPWQARHVIALEPSRARAYQLLEEYSTTGADVAAAFNGLPGIAAYQQRVEEWLSNGASAEENYEALYGAQDAYDAERAKAFGRSLDRFDRR